MTTSIILIITLILGFLYLLALWFNYKKEKADDLRAKTKFAKRVLIVGAVIIVLNIVNPLVNLLSRKEEPATKKDIKRIEDRLSKLSEPTQKEVENEIDKQFRAEFGKKKRRALEEYQKGVSAYKSYNFILAISHFEKAIKIFAIPSFYNSRGNSFFLTSQFDQSISDYTEAIRLNQNYPPAYNNRGIVWREKGNYDRALADYDKAIQLNSNLAEAYMNRGIALSEKGDYDKAFADYDKAIQLKPHYAEAYINRGIDLREKGDYGKAFADYDKAIQLKPNYAEAYVNRGIAWREKGDHDKALVDYDKAIQLKPDYAGAYNNRGNAWSEKGDYGKALADYDKAIQLNSNLAEAFKNRGNAHSKLRHNKEAAQDFNHYLKIGGAVRGEAEEVRKKIRQLGYNPVY